MFNSHEMSMLGSIFPDSTDMGVSARVMGIYGNQRLQHWDFTRFYQSNPVSRYVNLTSKQGSTVVVTSPRMPVDSEGHLETNTGNARNLEETGRVGWIAQGLPNKKWDLLIRPSKLKITFVDPAELIICGSANLLQFAIEAMTIESSWIFPLIAWWIFPISFLLTFTRPGNLHWTWTTEKTQKTW